MILGATLQIVGKVERKLCIVGLGKLALSPYMTKDKEEGLVKLVDTLISLTQTSETFTANRKEVLKGALVEEEDELEQDFEQAGVVELKSAENVVMDAVPEIQNTREYTAFVIKKVCEMHGDIISNAISKENMAFLREL